MRRRTLPDQRQLQRAALRLMPKSKRQLARRLARQRQIVLQLRRQLDQAEDPASRAFAERRLKEEAGKLRRMLRGAKKRRLRRPQPRIQTLDAYQARARQVAITRELSAIDKTLGRLARLSRKGARRAVRRQLRIQYQMLKARQKLLIHRLRLLEHGKDLEQAPRVHPSRLPIQRAKLGLPRTYSAPQPGEVIVALRLLASSLKRHSGESDRRFRFRLRAYLQRALVRYLHKKHQMSANQALVQSVEETVEVDSPAIEAEVEQGAFAADPAAEAVDAMIEPVADELVRVTDDIQPPVGATPVQSVEEVDALLAESGELAEELGESPAEVQDQLEEQLGDGSALVSQDEKPSREDGRVNDSFETSGQDSTPEEAPSSAEVVPFPASVPEVSLPESLPDLPPSDALPGPDWEELDLAELEAELDKLEQSDLAEQARRVSRESVPLPVFVGGMILTGFVVYIVTRR